MPIEPHRAPDKPHQLNQGFTNGHKPTTLTDEEAMELFRSNGRNHPRTRMSVAERVVFLRNNPVQKQPEQNQTD